MLFVCWSLKYPMLEVGALRSYWLNGPIISLQLLTSYAPKEVYKGIKEDCGADQTQSRISLRTLQGLVCYFGSLIFNLMGTSIIGLLGGFIPISTVELNVNMLRIMKQRLIFH